jgi:hypothetical protein
MLDARLATASNPLRSRGMQGWIAQRHWQPRTRGSLTWSAKCWNPNLTADAVALKEPEAN